MADSKKGHVSKSPQIDANHPNSKAQMMEQNRWEWIFIIILVFSHPKCKNCECTRVSSISANNFLENCSFFESGNVVIFIQSPHCGIFLLHKLNSCCRNYLFKVETIQGNEIICGNTVCTFQQSICFKCHPLLPLQVLMFYLMLRAPGLIWATGQAYMSIGLAFSVL